MLNDPSVSQPIRQSKKASFLSLLHSSVNFDVTVNLVDMLEETIFFLTLDDYKGVIPITIPYPS